MHFFLHICAFKPAPQSGTNSVSIANNPQNAIQPAKSCPLGGKVGKCWKVPRGVCACLVFLRSRGGRGMDSRGDLEPGGSQVVELFPMGVKTQCIH